MDASDFAFTTTGTVTPVVTLVSGTGATRTVTVSTGAGEGTIRLDVLDDDTIIDVDGNPLGGVGAGNGAFTSGEVVVINATVAGIPTLDPRALVLMAVLLGGAAIFALRRI